MINFIRKSGELLSYRHNRSLRTNRKSRGVPWLLYLAHRQPCLLQSKVGEPQLRSVSLRSASVAGWRVNSRLCQCLVPVLRHQLELQVEPLPSQFCFNNYNEKTTIFLSKHSTLPAFPGHPDINNFTLSTFHTRVDHVVPGICSGNQAGMLSNDLYLLSHF